MTSYKVLMNNRYMNSFQTYSKAVEFANWLRARYPKAIVEIESAW